MTTAIATTGGEGKKGNLVTFGSLSPDSKQMQIIAANTAGEPISELDLTRVRTPSAGSTTWEIDESGNATSTKEIVGVLTAVGRRGELWPFFDPKKEAPVIVSPDFKIGYRVGDKLGTIDPKALEKYRTGDRTYDWEAMATGPDFGPGTGKDQIGRRCKESRILAVLRDGDIWPVLVSVGPGSLGVFLPFLKKLPCFHYAAVVGLSLRAEESKGGQPYSMIVPRLVGELSDEQAEFVKEHYTTPLNAMFAAPPNMVGGGAQAPVAE